YICLYLRKPSVSKPQGCQYFLLLATHLLGEQIMLLSWVVFAFCLSRISLHITLNSKGLSGSASSPDLQLLLRNREPGDEEDEDKEEKYLVSKSQR
uniref:Uncharacterized protein n=1 Tax=Vombatus ursinus TaxID=29139 RepID=A0A4X2LKR2_VOMUR